MPVLSRSELVHDLAAKHLDEEADRLVEVRHRDRYVIDIAGARDAAPRFVVANLYTHVSLVIQSGRTMDECGLGEGAADGRAARWFSADA